MHYYFFVLTHIVDFNFMFIYILNIYVKQRKLFKMDLWTDTLPSIYTEDFQVLFSTIKISLWLSQ